MTKIHCGASDLICDSVAEWSSVLMAYFSKYTTSRPLAFADFLHFLRDRQREQVVARQDRDLLHVGAFALTILVSGVVSVSLGVKVPNRYL